MPKQFYTEKDIEDIFNRGTRSLQVTDDIVLTELAYEKARRLGIQLLTDRADNPPAAPVRPYLSDWQAVPTKPKAVLSSTASSQPAQPQPNVLPVEQRIRSAVIAKLGDQVDRKLLDTIIHRVVKGIGLK
jgi:hypothetical protein